MKKIKKILKNLFSSKKRLKKSNNSVLIKDLSQNPLKILNEVVEFCPCGKNKKDCLCGDKCSGDCSCKSKIDQVIEVPKMTKKKKVASKKSTASSSKKPKSTKGSKNVENDKM
jgi:hypothetical protein